MLKRRSAVSTRFIIYTAIVYSLIIIVIVLSFAYLLKINSDILKEIVLKNDDTYFIKKSGLIVERLKDKERKIKNLKDISNAIKKYCLKDNDFLYVLIYSKTADENFFKIQKQIPLNNAFKINVSDKKIVQEKKDYNYLKIALTKPVIDPVIYSSDNIYYKTVYYPYTLNENSYVIEFIVSSSEIVTTLNYYSEKINNIKKYSIIVSACAVILVIIITLLFNYNFSLLVKNLSGHLKKAAEGSLEGGISSGKDDDLDDLAMSFTGIISELKSRKDLSGELFKTGVELLKQENYSDAIAVFKTLTIVNPNAFGSFFNLGVAYAKKKQYEISLAMFEKALYLNPGHTLTLDYVSKVKRLNEAYTAKT